MRNGKGAGLSLAAYSLLHFAVDLTCAAAMFSRVHPRGELWGLAMLLYNYFAFAMQLPLGILADKLNKNSLVAGLGCLTVALGCCFPGSGYATAVLCGIGNGLFHVGGGLDVLNGSAGKCAPAGIFVSPGALGLWIGTVWGMSGGFSPLLPLLLALSGIALPLFFRGTLSGGHNAELSLPPAKSPLWAGVALLFSVVALRGLAGMIFSFGWKEGLALPYILAVVLGKAAGGFSADLLGEKKTSVLSLSAAALLFLFSSRALPGLMAVFLFNMTMPLTLTRAASALSGAKGMSFGLMTFGLFLGFLPVYAGFSSSSTLLYSALSILSLGLMLPGLILCERGGKK